MGRQNLEWFLAPRDVKPNTTITLGKLIVNNNKAEGPPYLEKALPVPIEEQIELKYPWDIEKEKSRGGKLGLFASFLALAGVGGSVSGNLLVGRSDKIEVDELQTLKFEPSQDYLDKTMNLPKNREFLVENDYKKPLFIVTGIKVAHGARVTKSVWKDWGGDGSVSVSPHAPGVTIGPDVSITHHTKTVETTGGSHDFVWAFLLNKVHYSKEKERFVQEKHVRGAAYSLDDDVDINTVAAEEQAIGDESGLGDVIEVHGVESQYAGGQDFGVESGVVFDEETGEECLMVPWLAD